LRGSDRILLTKLGVVGFSIVYLLIGFASSLEVSSLFAIGRNMVTSKNNGTVLGLMNFMHGCSVDRCDDDLGQNH
jgi:hypothetical protein